MTGSILAEMVRGNHVENQYMGWLVVTDAKGSVKYATPGAVECQTYFRSSAKPFQVLPMVAAGFHQQLTQQELALACASHTGTDAHVLVVTRLLEKAGLTDSALQCGIHSPVSPAVASQLIRQGNPITPLHNNCSGQHAALLYFCMKQGWEISTYQEESHPLQQEILAHFKELLGLKALDDIDTGTDGCGMRTYYLALPLMAQLYGQLVKTELCAPVVEAMTAYPDMVAGDIQPNKQALDTVLMQVSDGNLVCKAGAQGVYCMSNRQTGEGMAVKIASGDKEIRNRVVVAAVKQLGWLTESALTLDVLQPFSDPVLLNLSKEPVGRYQITLSGLA
ncbi:MAG: asparaginase [Vampirovibrio sp.]|nr:asparaginase [Vampirovibrio sp.]